MGDLTIQALQAQFPGRARYLTLKEASAYATCHPQSLRKAFKMRALRGFRRGQRLYFLIEDLDKWMRGFEQRPTRTNNS